MNQKAKDFRRKFLLKNFGFKQFKLLLSDAKIDNFRAEEFRKRKLKLKCFQDLEKSERWEAEQLQIICCQVLLWKMEKCEWF